MVRSWRWVEHFLEGVISLCLVAMAGLTVIDVAGRYFFNAPLKGGYEISELLMGLTVFASLPLATRAESHLTISLLTDRLRGGFRRWHRIVILIVTCAALAFIGWRMGVQAGIFYNSKIASGSLQLTLWPFAAIMAVLAWLSAAVALVLTLRALAGYDADARGAHGSLE
ncbi:MAG: TRAP transporter small permease [Pseudooceanicola sp.]|nr:TRAP transporter small permease [Pseudooceanicola sp.]